MIAEWFFSAGFGILLGILPSWGWFIAKVADVTAQHRKIPPWIVSLALGKPVRPGKRPFGISRQYLDLLTRIISLVIVITVLGRYQYYIWSGYITGTITVEEIIILETGLTPFLLLTWLLPSVSLELYLRRRESRNRIKL